jgi:hypothetical protein
MIDNFSFIDEMNFLIIFLPLMIVSIAMHRGAGVHWSLILRDLGVPMGLIIAFLSFLGMLTNMSDPDALGSATSYLLLAVIYGGILASIGYFWSFRSIELIDVPERSVDVKWSALAVATITILSAVIYYSWEAFGLIGFIEDVPFLVFTASALLALLICNRKNMLQALSQSFLLSAMINVVIGIIYYYHEEIGVGIAIGLLGIVYALTAYICLYFLSFKLGDPKKLDAPLMNWHWLEVSGFLIFMFLAPVSLAEFASNMTDDEKEEKLELRIQELERKLDLLSQQTTQ